MDQPKIERLLRLMKMLTANTTYNVDEIAERLSMSRRTVYRYIDTFREAGFVIKREGECIRLDKESPHFKDITQLVHFTEEEATILRRSIEGIDDTNMLKAELKRKLYSVYDQGVLSAGRGHGIEAHRHATNIHKILEAIQERRVVVLKGYQSAHGGAVRDRVVEPFVFTPGYVQLWCYDREDGRNKLFKSARIGAVELLDDLWDFDMEHKSGLIDIFRMNGQNPMLVKLEMGLLAYNLLLEEYPLAERDLIQIGENRWRLESFVASYVGVGRFVVGLLDDIEIVDSPEFVEYLRGYISRFRYFSNKE